MIYQRFPLILARRLATMSDVPARRTPADAFPLATRGTRGIRYRRQGHLPESWSWCDRTHRDQDHHGHDLRVLSAPHGERDDGLCAVDNVDGVGLRRAISDEEVERLFNLLGDGKIDSHQNWKGRFKDNSDRMRTGSIYDVVEVLKSLTFLSKSKSLSFREKRMLDRAKFLVVSEITEVLGEKTPAVEDKVDKALERCFLTKARTRPAPRPWPRPAPRPCRSRPCRPPGTRASRRWPDEPLARPSSPPGSDRASRRSV